MDNFDEFEFKPLTQGLGFHKKTIDLGNEVKKTGLGPETPPPARKIPVNPYSAPQPKKETASAETVSRLIASIPSFDNPGEEKSAPKFEPTLPREEIPAFRSPRLHEITKKVDVPVAEPKLSFEMERKTDFTPTPVRNKVSVEPLPARLAEKGFSIGAFIFDVFVVIGLTSLFTGIVLAVTGADFNLVLTNAQSDIATRLSLILLVLSVIELYLVLSRSFFGATLGEWAMDIEIGNEIQQKSALYPLAIAWRSLLVMMTGFVLLPLISMIFGKDIAGRLSGPRRYRKS